MPAMLHNQKWNVKLDLSYLAFDVHNIHRYLADILIKKKTTTGYWEPGKAKMGKQNVISQNFFSL